MRAFIVVLMIIGCGGSATKPVDLKLTVSPAGDFPQRAKAFLAESRTAIDALKTERVTPKLKAISDKINALHASLNQTVDTEKDEDLSKLLEKIAVNIGTAVDFTIDRIAAEKSNNPMAEKNAGDTCKVLVDAVQEMCDKADGLLS